LKPPISIGGSSPPKAIYLLFKNITSIHVKCDVFEKKIDVGLCNFYPPIKIGGFKMIDVLIVQLEKITAALSLNLDSLFSRTIQKNGNVSVCRQINQPQQDTNTEYSAYLFGTFPK
jgi:hydrogenase maturation factor